MSKKAALNTKLLIALSVFLVFFISVVFLLIRLSNANGSGGQTNTETPPQTGKYDSYPIVIIDAGHGGEDGGAVGVDGTLEKDVNLAIALELEEMLRSEGIKTRLTRDSDILLYDRNSDYHGHKKSQDMAARLSIAQEYKDAVFISIHLNSFSQSKYRGLQVYYSPNSPLSQKLAQIVQQTVCASLQPTNNRKIKASDSNIYLLDKIQHPAILIECGFLSNPEECSLLSDPDYRTKLCLCIFSSIVEYFKEFPNISPTS